MGNSSWVENHPFKMALIMGIVTVFLGYMILNIQSSRINLPFDWDEFLIVVPCIFGVTYSAAGLSHLSEGLKKEKKMKLQTLFLILIFCLIAFNVFYFCYNTFHFGGGSFSGAGVFR